MNDVDVTKVKNIIKNHIKGVGDEKIKDRTQDKIAAIYKLFFVELYDKSKPIMKINSDVKIKISEIKSRKLEKGLTKKDKNRFSKLQINELITSFKQHNVLADVVLLSAEIKNEVTAICNWNIYEQWIAWVLDFGADSYLATHIAKLTHSSSKGSSVDVRYHDSCNKYNNQYLCTPTTPILDTAYPDNKYSSISQFYSITVDGSYIGDLLRDNAEEYLCELTKDKKLLEYWATKFSELIKNEKKQSYFLSKQTYFPLVYGGYHLLLPLTSSSLLHEIHLTHRSYFENEQTTVRKLRGEKKYSTVLQRSFPNKAYLHVTGSNHSNASSLNGKRGGRLALLPAMPPQWQSNRVSYINKTTLFDGSLTFALSTQIAELKKYLLLIKNKELSISEPKRNAAVMAKLKAISNEFFDYIEIINCTENKDGWTITSTLPIEQQLVIEPWRTDDTAKQIKFNKQWQETLSNSYARWLNNQLNKDKKLNLTLIHSGVWRDAFANELRKNIAIQEVG